MQKRIDAVSARILEHIEEVVYRIRAPHTIPFQGEVDFVSAQVTSILGYRPEEFAQNPSLWFSIVHPDDIPVVDKATRELYATREAGIREYRLRHKITSEYHWMEDRVVPELDASGAVAGFFGVARDISERKATAETFRSIVRGVSAAVGNSFFPTLVHHLAVGLEVEYALVGKFAGPARDRIGTIAAWVDGDIAKNYEYEIAGTPCEQVLEKGFICYPRGVSALFASLAAPGAGNIEGFAGVPLPDQSGSSLGVLLVMSRKPLKQGELIKSVLVIYAARASAELQRLRTEQRVRDNRDFLEQVLESSASATVVLDLRGEVTLANRAATQLVGQANESIVGRHFLEFAHPEAVAQAAELFSRAIQPGASVISFEIDIVSGDGGRRTIRANAAPLCCEDAISGVVVSAVDITEKKASDAALLAKSEQLDTVTTALLSFLERGSYREAAERILEAALKQTGSNFGFVGEVTEGSSLRVLVHAGVTWDETINREFYEESLHSFAQAGHLEFRNLKSLYGEVIQTGRVVVANDPVHDSRSGGLPPGHPQLDCFLGVPIGRNPRVVGVIGVANRPGGYSGHEQEKIQILCHAAEVLYDSYQRRNREAALEAQHTRLAMAVESSGESVIITDTGGTIEFVNRAFELMHGYERREVLGCSPRILKSGKHSEVFYRDMWETLLSGKIWHGVVTNRRKDGSMVHVEETIAPVRDADGKTTSFVAIERDVSARLQAEEVQARLTAILEATPDFVGISDARGVAVYLNRAGREMLGFGAADDISQFNMLDIYPGWARRIVLSEGLSTALRDGFWSGKTALLHHTRGEIPMSQVILAHKSKEGKVEFLSSIGRDITELRRIEEQLWHSQKMEAVGQFAGGIAHDFNNMLSAILGYCDFVSSALPQEHPVRPDLDGIRGAGDRAAALVRQLLAFSRKQVLQPAVVDLNLVVGDLGKMIPRLIGENIEFSMQLCAGLGLAEVDVGQIEQVVMNLVVNARDAMPDGGKLTIETANVELSGAEAPDHSARSPGSYVALSVSDTGVGMNAEVQKHIFEPFFTTKDRGKGTGLGLATVYGIVRQSGGDIRVASAPGCGATFSIYLPCTKSEPVSVLATMATPGSERLHGSETVLVVEDDAAIRALSRRSLELYGYNVLVASCGEEAIQMVEQLPEPIDLVVTDVIMPGITGKELAHRLEVIQPGVRVLYMSGYLDNAILHSDDLSKGVALLQKPFPSRVLLAKIRELLDHSASAPGPRRANPESI